MCHLETKSIPSEISILYFTLNSVFDQNQDLFHCFVDPGKLPLGYTSEAKRNSEKTELPFPPNAKGYAYEEIGRKLDYFFSQFEEEAVECPLIFTMDDDIIGCSEAMKVLYVHSNKVLSLPRSTL